MKGPFQVQYVTNCKHFKRYFDFVIPLKKATKKIVNQLSIVNKTKETKKN